MIESDLQPKALSGRACGKLPFSPEEGALQVNKGGSMSWLAKAGKVSDVSDV